MFSKPWQPCFSSVVTDVVSHAFPQILMVKKNKYQKRFYACVWMQDLMVQWFTDWNCSWWHKMLNYRCLFTPFWDCDYGLNVLVTKHSSIIQVFLSIAMGWWMNQWWLVHNLGHIWTGSYHAILGLCVALFQRKHTLKRAQMHLNRLHFSVLLLSTKPPSDVHQTFLGHPRLPLFLIYCKGIARNYDGLDCVSPFSPLHCNCFADVADATCINNKGVAQEKSMALLHSSPQCRRGGWGAWERRGIKAFLGWGLNRDALQRLVWAK